MSKMQTVREKPKLIGLVNIRGGSEVLVGAKIHRHRYIEPLAFKPFDVKSGKSMVDLGNGFVLG